jgi:EPS-associated MarR family transcriptional regulator
MPSRQSQLQEDTIFRVLRLLQHKPDVTQRELAAHLGMSLGGLNYCLRALVEKGLVTTATLNNDKSQRKSGYLLTPAGLAHRILLTGRFLARKQRELEALQLEIQVLADEVQAHDGYPIPPALQLQFPK